MHPPPAARRRPPARRSAVRSAAPEALASAGADEKRGSRHPRGAAAVEFALIAPLLMAVLIGFFVLGMMLVARYQIHTITVGTVRSCVALQNTTDSLGQYTSCLSTQFPTILAASGNPCSGNPVITPEPLQQLSQTGSPINGSHQKIYLLRATVRCDYNIGAISALLPKVPSKVTFNVTSAMPFVKG